MVAEIAVESLTQLKEEITHTDAFPEDAPGVEQALSRLESVLMKTIDQDMLDRSLRAASVRIVKRNEAYDETVQDDIL